MLPEIYVLGQRVVLYGLMIVLGITAGILTALVLNKEKLIKNEDIIFAYLYGAIGAVAGGKILYLLIEIPRIITNFKLFLDNPEYFQLLLSGGFVFYGSLVGGLLMVYLYCRKYNVSIPALSMVIIPTIPLIHSFGRIGCFFAGCCYGIGYDGIASITFKNSPVAPNGVPLFPVQLLESITNLMIFIILIFYRRRARSYKNLIVLYLILYSLARFVLEFFRGDIVRGFIFGLSTSQWISLLIIVAISVYYIKSTLIDHLLRENSKQT
ncbi:MAG: prolipoprotein diacylglyceryl transferase [Caldicoprobacterales bacterium]|jgi:phosphatidylglycerol:prolipoprotein diacylglycerol transferase|nr:prolipoprotein diacylglyceryl transferase [Clostridiales bacterium]